jgi:hypothetical protein
MRLAFQSAAHRPLGRDAFTGHANESSTVTIRNVCLKVLVVKLSYGKLRSQNIRRFLPYVRAVFSEGCFAAHPRHEETTLLMSTQATGSCLCKSVSYETDGTLNPVLACHCSQCAKTSGNFAAMTSCAADKVRILSDATLRWFQSSEAVSRGFCSRCGSNLFWKQLPLALARKRTQAISIRWAQ